ncbi:MAG: tRNA 5-methoxyuridine(34)/uridine 5-oxyacetic acid(34) synthase CmoB [Xanthomonadales bacterium]|nr:tRNA 5-methoxyuridine(34)/uridine 5-oxyacetic acid(34) synthase CmoB [Xanthomonadales bacterium]
MNAVYGTLAGLWPSNIWLQRLCRLADERLAAHPHGDLDRWLAAVEALPDVGRKIRLDRPAPRLGADAPDQDGLRDTLMQLHPWRKGPLVLAGQLIETEWRSDWKWDRVAPHLDLAGKRVLDIGCGNGYFGLRMLGSGADLVVGIDPTVLFVAQWLACRRFSDSLPNYVLPLGIEDLQDGPSGFDTVFSMGVLYHRRRPGRHLERLRGLMEKSGSTLVLETLVLPKGREDDVLAPEGRYARMRNVWSIPGTDRLLDWVRAAGFSDARVVDITETTVEEQRRTEWMRFESLAEALDPEDETRTIEGWPAPVRAVITARS